VNSLALMDKVLAGEKPDYVYVLGLFSLFLVLKMLHDRRVLNGDLITGEGRQRVLTIFPSYPKIHKHQRPNLDTFRENSTSLIDEIVGPLNKAKVPFSSTHGVSSKHLFHMVILLSVRLEP